MSGGKLLGIVYRVKNPQMLAMWYEKVLGMDSKEMADKTWICSYPGNGAHVKLLPGSGTPYRSDRNSVYWKIGLALQDVDLARERIIDLGTSVSSPAQFMEIGYLCHLADPDGYSLELLQHTFAKNFVKPDAMPDRILGQDPLIGQITLRCSDIEKSLKFYQDAIGMKLLSIQSVAEYGFTLYFLAFTDEEPPNKDLNSVENREWLWQRPYTTLELQHRSGAQLIGMDSVGCGVDSMELETSSLAKQRLESSGFEVTNADGHCLARDPDGTRVRISFV